MWAGPNELDLFVPELVAGSVPAINLSVPELVTECVCRSCRVNLSVPELVTECVCRSCRVNLSVPELVAGSVPELMRSRLFALSLGDRSLGDTALWATRRRRPCATRPEARLRKSFFFFLCADWIHIKDNTQARYAYMYATGGRPRLSEGEGPDPGEAVAAGAMQPLLTYVEGRRDHHPP
jgi:hypothetical protein